MNAVLSFYRTSGDILPDQYEDFLIAVVETEWDENTITWNNEPVYYPHLAVAFSGGAEDSSWIDFDITGTIQAMVKDSIENHGFIFGVFIEGRYATVYSSEESIDSLRPKLIISYDNDPVGTVNETTHICRDIRFRKAGGSYFIYVPFTTPKNISLYDISGREIVSFNTNGNMHWYTIPGLIASGMHVVRITTPQGNVVKKFNFAY